MLQQNLTKAERPAPTAKQGNNDTTQYVSWKWWSQKVLFKRHFKELSRVKQVVLFLNNYLTKSS